MKTSNRLNPERLSITLFAIFAVLLLSMKPAMASSAIDEDNDGFFMEIEEWMTSPFEVADYFEIESWMTAPFEISISEAELLVENWMTSPFEADEYAVEDYIVEDYIVEDYIEIESWMLTTF